MCDRYRRTTNNPPEMAVNTRVLLAVLQCCSSSPVPPAPGEAHGLVGLWKLISCQVIVDNEPSPDVFGVHPKGYLVLTREGRSIVLTTAENRKSGVGDAERAALHKSMLAYSGKYRIEGADFITLVDVSWNVELSSLKARYHRPNACI
jgi:hypothetical protein